MAALTADNVIHTQALNADLEGVKLDYQVAAEKIYKNGFVGLNDAGYLTMWTPTATGATDVGDRFIGISMAYVDNSAGSAGDKTCQVLVEGMFQYALTGAVIADTGAPVFATDDNTLSKVASSGLCVGYIVAFVSAGQVIVKLQPLGSINYSQPLITKVSPPLELATAGKIIRLIHPSENHNGLIILWCAKFLTVATDNASVITLYDSADTTLTVTITGTAGADAVGDHGGTGILTLRDGTLSDALVIVPADLGVYAKVTTATTTVGEAVIVLQAIPIA